MDYCLHNCLSFGNGIASSGDIMQETSLNIIRVFPRRTKWTPVDNLCFIGEPGFFLPLEMPVYISVTFTWDIPEAQRLQTLWSQYYKDVKIGGPAFNDAGEEFTPGMFLKKGVVITSRGCPNNCPWCFVPKREGKVRELEIKDGYIIQDNNLFACSEQHIKEVFGMLKRQKKPAIFSGGIESAYFKPQHRELLDTIKFEELWFACDSQPALKSLKNIVPLLEGIHQQKRRCYVMIGYGNETLYDAEKRLESVYSLGFDPFCQLYRGQGERKYNQKWKDLNRKWSRPAAYRSAHKTTTNNSEFIWSDDGTL